MSLQAGIPAMNYYLVMRRFFLAGRSAFAMLLC